MHFLWFFIIYQSLYYLFQVIWNFRAFYYLLLSSQWTNHENREIMSNEKATVRNTKARGTPPPLPPKPMVFFKTYTHLHFLLFYFFLFLRESSLLLSYENYFFSYFSWFLFYMDFFFHFYRELILYIRIRMYDWAICQSFFIFILFYFSFDFINSNVSWFNLSFNIFFLFLWN